MKKVYIAPLTEVEEEFTMESYLITASTQGNKILTDGGSASSGGINYSDDKDDDFDFADDLW